MRLFHNLCDKLRTMAGIRKERELPPAGEKPFIGTNIVREKLRIRLKYPINDELWKWLADMGWRAIDMRNNRRRYTVVPDIILVKLIKASSADRHVIHSKLLKAKKFERNSHEKELHLNSSAKIIKKSSI